MDAPTSAATSTILLVDDDKTSLMILHAKLKREGYRVLQADSAAAGQEILNEVGTSSIDLVLSDYWMPGRNGLEFLKSVRLQDSCLSVILMTADGERAILENLVQFGGCGFLKKPIPLDELAETVQTAIQRTRVQRHLKSTEIQANTLGENQRLLLKRQLEVSWPGIEFSFSSKSHASGDFVSTITLAGEGQVLLLSDASGHELSSALQSNYFHGLARGMLSSGTGLEDVFNSFNNTLLEEWSSEYTIGHSLAACGILFDPLRQKATFLNAGFPRPKLAGLDGFASALGNDTGNPPLGWFDHDYSTETTLLPEGTLIAWTDGLEDLADSMEVDQLALADRLIDPNQRNESLLAHSHDDMAVVRVTNPGTPDGANPMIPILHQIYCGADLDRIDSIQSFCENSIRYSISDADPGIVSEILVCIREALINALKHGCRGRQDVCAVIQIAKSRDGSKISIQIRDEGDGHNFDWKSHANEAADNLISEHRGLIMMQAIPSRTVVSHNGSHILMDFDETLSLN